ncbi:MAG: nucleoside phosphorylase [Desulfobacterales bacterium]
MEEAIIQPPARREDKRPIPPVVVLAATGPDLQGLRQALPLTDDRGEALYLSRIYQNAGDRSRFCLVGPFMGAPQAAMLLEVLSAWGAAHFLFLGWCGSIDPQLQIGDILLPTAAFIDEGTSRGYHDTRDCVHLPEGDLHGEVKSVLADQGQPYQEGPVWSTDAVFRETPSKVSAFQRRGALAVEMEISACLTVARLLKVRFAALLVVSDELFDFNWRPGFSDPRFQKGRRTASRTIEILCQTL